MMLNNIAWFIRLCIHHTNSGSKVARTCYGAPYNEKYYQANHVAPYKLLLLSNTITQLITLVKNIMHKSFVRWVHMRDYISYSIGLF